MPAGIDNAGNTCYMNSVIQTLKLIPEVIYAFNNYSQRDIYKANLWLAMDKIGKNNNSNITKNQAELLIDPEHRKNQKTIAVLGQGILDDIYKGKTVSKQKAKKFFNALKYLEKGGKQGDAPEMLKYILKMFPNSTLLTDRFYSKKTFNPNGTLYSNNIQPDNIFVLKQFKAELEDMIQTEFNSNYGYQNPYRLQNNIITNADLPVSYEINKISDTTKTLIFQISRQITTVDSKGNIRTNKNNQKINVRKEITLQGKTFELSGIIYHTDTAIGKLANKFAGLFNKSMNLGHYYSYTKSINGQWYHENDSKTSAVAEDAALEQAKTAYVLYFRLV